MRVVDRRIRLVAREVDDYELVVPAGLHRLGWTDNPAEWEGAVEWRASARRDAIATAVNILEVLDADIIHQWQETAHVAHGRLHIQRIVHINRDDPPDLVQVTVRRTP